MSIPATTRALLLDLRGRGLVPEEVVVEGSPAQGRAREAIRALGDDPPPWFVRGLVGAGTWIGACLLAIVPMMTGIFDHDVPRLFLGALCIAGAAALSRAVPPAARGVFLGQATLIGATAGGLLVTVGFLGSLFRSTHEAFFTSCIVVAVAVTALVRDAVVRFVGAALALASTMMLAVSLEMPLGHQGPAALGVALAIAVFALDAPLAARGLRELARPAAFGLAFAALIAAQFPVELWGALPPAAVGGPGALATASIAHGLLLALVAGLALGERGAGIVSPAGGATLLAIAGATGATLGTPAVSASLAVLALGRLRGEPLLHGAGLAGLSVALAVYFLDERRGLYLQRGLTLASLGVVLLVARSILARAFMSAEAAEAIEAGGGQVTRPPQTQAASESPVDGTPRLRASRIRAAGLIGATALVLLIVAGSVLARERILASGERVVVPSRASVGERSLAGLSVTLDLLVEGDAPPDLAWPLEGTLVLRVDGRGVSRFARLDDGSPLAAGERRLRFRRPEGRSVTYAGQGLVCREGSLGGRTLWDAVGDARFVELRVDEAGAAVATALLGESLTRIAERAP